MARIAVRRAAGRSALLVSCKASVRLSADESGPYVPSVVREVVLERWRLGLDQHRVNVRYGAEVTAIRGARPTFEITLANGEVVRAAGGIACFDRLHLELCVGEARGHAQIGEQAVHDCRAG